MFFAGASLHREVITLLHGEVAFYKRVALQHEYHDIRERRNKKEVSSHLA
jgi:hypothetical protein